MKLFLMALVLSTLLVIVTFAALLSASPGVTIAGFCSFSGFGFPLLWVAIYRLWSQYAVSVRRR